MKQKSANGRNNKLIFVVGPTAVGKSGAAYRLAKKINGEIISCDSMQAYRQMQITNQAPSRLWRRSIPHHLIEIKDPTREYSAAEFRKKALALIKDIIEKGKIPLVVGGSGLYMKALLDGLFPSPRKDAAFRKKLQERAQLKGRDDLYSELKAVDPDGAAKIHPNDTRRVIRALEVYYLTGRPISWHKKNTQGISREYDIKIFGLTMPRDVLYKKIADRVEEMFAKGLVEEVRKLSAKKLSITAKSALGYKEVGGYLKGEYGLDKATELLKRNTRRFAKRQISWFRPDKRIKWIDVYKLGIEKSVNDMVKEIKYGKSCIGSDGI